MTDTALTNLPLLSYSTYVCMDGCIPMYAHACIFTTFNKKYSRARCDSTCVLALRRWSHEVEATLVYKVSPGQPVLHRETTVLTKKEAKTWVGIEAALSHSTGSRDSRMPTEWTDTLQQWKGTNYKQHCQNSKHGRLAKGSTCEDWVESLQPTW